MKWELEKYWLIDQNWTKHDEHLTHDVMETSPSWNIILCRTSKRSCSPQWNFISSFRSTFCFLCFLRKHKYTACRSDWIYNSSHLQSSSISGVSSFLKIKQATWDHHLHDAFPLCFPPYSCSPWLPRSLGTYFLSIWGWMLVSCNWILMSAQG